MLKFSTCNVRYHCTAYICILIQHSIIPSKAWKNIDIWFCERLNLYKLYIYILYSTNIFISVFTIPPNKINSDIILDTYMLYYPLSFGKINDGTFCQIQSQTFIIFLWYLNLTLAMAFPPSGGWRIFSWHWTIIS